MSKGSHRFALVATALVVLVVALALACLLFGSVDIDARSIFGILTGHDSDNEAWNIIVLRSRLPMIVTAMLAGAALSVSGLLLQTTFNNPLAGPSILGVSSGAGLGVAVIMYFLNLIANITEKASFLKYVTPFGYCSGADLVANGSIDPAMAAIGILIGTAGVIAAYLKYTKKDIH